MNTNNDEKKYNLLTNKYKKTLHTDITCGFICCLFWIIGFILCFFLIPRQPVVLLDNLNCYTNGQCIGDFKFINKNFYKTYWKNPKLLLFWVPYSGQSIGEDCYNDGLCCDNNFYNKCTIKIGEFQSISKFKINSRNFKIKELYLVNNTFEEMSCTAWMLLNPYKDMSQRLLTTGHVNVKTIFTDFENVNIREEYYYIKN